MLSIIARLKTVFQDVVLFPIKLSQIKQRYNCYMPYINLEDGRKALIQDKIVAHYQDGRLLKGVTRNFVPNKDFFHFIPMDSPPGSKLLEIRTAGLKGLFFVKDFKGNPNYTEKKECDSPKSSVGRKIRVVFKDGELMIGTTDRYPHPPDCPGFFFVPADVNSNNESCFVYKSATQHVSLI
jgi:hypothetical protein